MSVYPSDSDGVQTRLLGSWFYLCLYRLFSSTDSRLIYLMSIIRYTLNYVPPGTPARSLFSPSHNSHHGHAQLQSPAGSVARYPVSYPERYPQDFYPQAPAEPAVDLSIVNLVSFKTQPARLLLMDAVATGCAARLVLQARGENGQTSISQDTLECIAPIQYTVDTRMYHLVTPWSRYDDLTSRYNHYLMMVHKPSIAMNAAKVLLDRDIGHMNLVNDKLKTFLQDLTGVPSAVAEFDSLKLITKLYEVNPTVTTEEICIRIDRAHAVAVQASTQSIDRSLALKISAALELVVADIGIQIDMATNASSLLELLATTLQDRSVNKLSLKKTTEILSTTGGPNHFTLKLAKEWKQSMVKAALVFVYEELEELFNSTRDPAVILDGLPPIYFKHFPDWKSPDGEDYELFSDTIVLINRFPGEFKKIIHDNAREFLAPPKKCLIGGPLYAGTTFFHQKWYKLYVAILFGVDVSSRSEGRLLNVPSECNDIQDEDKLWVANDFVANFGETHIDDGRHE